MSTPPAPSLAPAPRPGADVSPHRRGIMLVIIAVACFSSSAVLVQYARPLNSVEIAFWRLLIAGALVGVGALLSGQPLWPPRDRWGRYAIYGLIACLHFLLYITALSFTTIAHTLTLVYTSPIFVTLFSALFLRERFPRRAYPGLAVTIIGVIILTGFQPHVTPQMLIGDGLSLLSAACYGLYSIAGRHERERVGLFTYAGTVYTMAALWLAPLLPWVLGPAHYSLSTVGALFALGIVPLGIGHTLYNAGLRHTHATYINLIGTQEVTGGVLLGWLLLGQAPAASTVVGMVIALGGIAAVLVGATR